MESITRGIFAAAVAMTLAASASAQIISTSIPKGEQAQNEQGVNFHLMGGYTYWDFASIEKAKKENTSGSGGHNGVIAAGDVVFRVNKDVSIGAGGWFNKISDVTIICTSGPCLLGDFESSSTDTGSKLKAYSLYGSLFYKKVGVQGGLVHSSENEDVSLVRQDSAVLTSSDTTKSSDFDLFAVYRGGGKKSSFSAGVGIYHYAAIPAQDIRVLFNGTPAILLPSGEPFILNLPGQESTTSLSAFANASVNVVSHVSLDASFWFIGPSGKDAVTGDRLNDTATRFTIGVGVTL
jgi:hypothetical protein